MEKGYYLVYNGRQVGPMSLSELAKYNLNAHSLVWTQGMPDWTQAYTVPEVMGIINAQKASFSDPTMPPPEPIRFNQGQTPPPHSGGYNAVNEYGHYPQQPQPTSDKSNIAFGVLAILIGTLGIQYFYIGKTAAGLLTILISLVTCGLWSVIMLIQGILAICMTQQEFERKYVYTSSTFPIL